MTVHTQPNYQIRPASPPPADYPAAVVADSFAEQPFLPDFESRRAAFLQHVLKNPAPGNTKPAWYELARIAAGGTPHEGVIHAALDFIDARLDCADFVLHSILWMLYLHAENQQHGSNPQASRWLVLSDGLIERARRTTLNFKYFPNEPGIDSLCTWTENHYILYTSAAYLAGQLYPQQVFTNSGETGAQKMVLNRKRILRWLALRFHTGFSEWLSHVYYDEDLAALLSLLNFAADAEIRDKSELVLNLLLFDMALNSFKGVFASTHGRAYENTKKWASNEGTTDTSKLLFGEGIFSGFDNMSAVALALGRYRLPRVIEGVAAERQVENRQRMGIRLDEMEKWGLHADNFEDGMHTLTLEAYLHPKTIANTLRMFDLCNWWENSFLKAFKPYRRLLKLLGAIGGLPWLARLLERDACRNTREQVNLYTYKTPDTMLSTAQDYRKGYGGDQQHIWQATLGPDAVCFTTHPAKIDGATPNYWAGSGLLPRAAQYRQVAIIIYHIEKIPALYVPIRHFYTHAWFPKDQFDEVVEKNGWILARKADGYLALRPQHAYYWNNESARQKASSRGVEIRSNAEDWEREVIVEGAQNIWICQMGRRAMEGNFDTFVAQITSAQVKVDGLNVEYHSPGHGVIQFGWEGDFLVNGQAIPLTGYPRYDNPFAQTDFNASVVKITADGQELLLDWKQFENPNAVV